jgi:hypothetical protein
VSDLRSVEVASDAGPRVQARETTALEESLKLAPRLHVYLCMSVLRTMSLIAGAALLALGGSAIALLM